jgi:hypothetical protein
MLVRRPFREFVHGHLLENIVVGRIGVIANLIDVTDTAVGREALAATDYVHPCSLSPDRIGAVDGTSVNRGKAGSTQLKTIAVLVV